MKSKSRFLNTSAPQHRQSGLALMVALIALAAMTLAGVALVRSIDTNALIAGNLAFRQNATVSADAGIEKARTWLMSKSTTALQDNIDGEGYYATRMDTGGVDGKGSDITGSRTQSGDDNYKWKDANGDELGGVNTAKCEAANDATGNRICYVIHRMCSGTGAITETGANCALIWNANPGGSSKGAINPNVTYQQNLVGSGTPMTYYRISVRVAGPRNNNSFVQAFVQF